RSERRMHLGWFRYPRLLRDRQVHLRRSRLPRLHATVMSGALSTLRCNTGTLVMRMMGSGMLHLITRAKPPTRSLSLNRHRHPWLSTRSFVIMKRFRQQEAVVLLPRFRLK